MCGWSDRSIGLWGNSRMYGFGIEESLRDKVYIPCLSDRRLDRWGSRDI